MKRHLWTTLGLAMIAARATAELVPFAPPWDDSAAGPTDLRPIMKQGAATIAPVRVRDGHLYAGENRLRLFGANLTSGACFPDHATADGMAARMAKFGLNGVRMHFLDSTWGEVRLIDYATGDWNRWNPDAQDRLDYFLAQLKSQGIYWNVNLLVGRSFGKNDGVDAAIDKLEWKVAHAVGFFHAPHLVAQKAYARRLLEHVNPYTGLALCQDPALAVVEINNENGLLHTWLSAGLDDLPEPFDSDLNRQWNAWLIRRHRDSAALADAWGTRRGPLGEELLRNVSFADTAKDWTVEQHRGARAICDAAEGSVSLRVVNPADGGWAVQFNQRGFALRKGEPYTVRFRAAADSPRKITATVMQAHAPWQNLGWQTRLDLSTDWKTFVFTFVADTDDTDARFGFNDLAQAGATFRFSDVSLKPGGNLGLQEDENLENATVRRPKTSDVRPLTAGRRQDWIRFLWETERAYWESMRRCITDELGVKAPVVGTIVATSTPNLMAGFDLVDTHAYWQHPHFPGRPWDQDNWIVKSLSMADHPEDATLSRLAWQRVAGKPHMVSEYNHPAPNPYAGEGPLMLAAVAAFQDWDALFYYTWSHDESKTKAGRIPHFFDIGQHPTIMANLPAAALLFRRGDVATARERVTATLPPETELTCIARHDRSWSVLDLNRLGVDLGLAFEHRVALDLSSVSTASHSTTSALARTEWLADTGELAWRLQENGQGLFEVRAPRTKLLVGRSCGRTVNLGHGVRVTAGQTSLGWCTISLSLLEGESFDRKPQRALLTATAYTQNTGMEWKDDTRTSVGTRWGNAPSLVEPVAATVSFASAAGPVRLYPLDERGQRCGPAVEAAAGGSSLAIGPPHRTLWYEIEFGVSAPPR